MKNKKILLMIIFSLAIVISLNFIVSATEGCCEKTNDGAWCQLAEKSDCSGSWAPTSCESSTFCQKGTCINENSGTCTPNTPKGPCESEGGKWDSREKDQVPECKLGCCILGQEVALTNEPSCENFATQYGVNVNFREDITSQEECFSLDTSVKEGACVLESSSSTSDGNSGGFFSNLFGGGSEQTQTASVSCKRTTQSECSTLGGNFNKGLLCSAQGLSDCAKSKDTIIEKGKVYFKDTCGNKANIYDESLFNDLDYWKNIQDARCLVGETPSSSCGDCSYRLGTIAAEYKTGDQGMPTKAPKYGKNVCRELSCYYDTNGNGEIDSNEKYTHGESWCAESEGTYPHPKIILSDEERKDLKDNYNDYNLPGSRYYKLKCYDGEVIVEPCKEFRNSVCREIEDNKTGETRAACLENEGITCLKYTTKSSCENEGIACKWIPGYTVNGTLVGDGELNGTKIDEYNEKQGSCYSLFPSGNKFWAEEGQTYCSDRGSVQERVLYETGIGRKRKDFANKSVDVAIHSCFDGCYAIPGYGSSDGKNYLDIKTLKEFQLGKGGVSDRNYLSKREGYYCKKKVEEPDSTDNSKTGKDTGGEVKCASDDSKDLARRRVKPYYTHKQWLESIRERARSSGDCGYKPHAFSDKIITKDGVITGTGWKGDAASEIITVVFQKLKQNKEAKETIGTKIILYKGDDETPNTGYRKLGET